MRKVGCILITIILLIITGCSRKEEIIHNYIYRGENDLWSAELKVNGKGLLNEKGGKIEYDISSENVFIVTYKKDLTQLSSVKHLEISYESSAGGGKVTEDFTDGPPSKKTYTMKSGSKGGAIEKKDEVIKVTINLDGKIQRIDLKSVK